jgi:hypothetical protein
MMASFLLPGPSSCNRCARTRSYCTTTKVGVGPTPSAAVNRISQGVLPPTCRSRNSPKRRLAEDLPQLHPEQRDGEQRDGQQRDGNSQRNDNSLRSECNYSKCSDDEGLGMYVGGFAYVSRDVDWVNVPRWACYYTFGVFGMDCLANALYHPHGLVIDPLWDHFLAVYLPIYLPTYLSIYLYLSSR